MIGNDIVDLTLASAQSDWKRKGWIQKVFTLSEQKMIQESDDLNRMVWKLWSMKEATYKAHQRRFSIPPKCNPWDFVCGNMSVTVNNFRYQTESKCTEKFVYTVSYIDQTDFISRIFANPSVAYKHFLFEHIAHIKQVDPSKIRLQKDANGVPNIIIDNSITNIPVSLSSHGLYSAFMIDL